MTVGPLFHDHERNAHQYVRMSQIQMYMPLFISSYKSHLEAQLELARREKFQEILDNREKGDELCSR